MTSWDLSMDPMMVAGGNWIWERPGAYFGIPIHNFIGWWFTTFSAVLLYQLLLPSREGTGNDRPAGLALIFYAAAGLSTALIDLLVGMPGPGFVGAFAMLSWILAVILADWGQRKGA
jgi:putative membrane protein